MWCGVLLCVLCVCPRCVVFVCECVSVWVYMRAILCRVLCVCVQCVCAVCVVCVRV